MSQCSHVQCVQIMKNDMTIYMKALRHGKINSNVFFYSLNRSSNSFPPDSVEAFHSTNIKTQTSDHLVSTVVSSIFFLFF